VGIACLGFSTRFVILRSDNKINIYGFPGLKLLKSIFVDDTVVSIDFDRWNLFAIFVFCENKVFYIDISELKDSNPGTPVIVTESKIRCACVGNKYIITGHDEGNVFLWERTSGNIFKHANTFSQHKGTLTNLILINRPISQYGLNFNSNIEEAIFKPLKKQNASHTAEITLNKSVGVDYIETFLNRKLKSTANFITDQFSQNTKSKNDDPVFLKKKLNDLYSLLNNH
jgi:hypothetical protein